MKNYGMKTGGGRKTRPMKDSSSNEKTRTGGLGAGAGQLPPKGSGKQKSKFSNIKSPR